MKRLLKPYVDEPPPGLYGAARPDLLIRAAGTIVPHFLSVLMRIGGEGEMPAFAVAANRRTVRISERRNVAENEDVVALTLAAADGSTLSSWHPGAHIDLHLPSGRTRQYSLCGDPREAREYRIAVRLISDGQGGSAEVHRLQVGQTVEISCPRNAFMMPLPGSGSPAEKLRFLAGGIGITPILPMVRLADQRGVPWSLCYTGRHRGSLPFLEELRVFGDRVRVRTDDEDGLPTAAELMAGVDGRTAVYACGPPPMIDAIRAGIPSDWTGELHAERFSPPPVVNGLPFELEFARSHEVVEVVGTQSALSALRAARPDVSYSCQQGFCGSCVQQVLTGEVEHRDTILTDRQREVGQMLMCVSRAKGEGGRLVLDL